MAASLLWGRSGLNAWPWYRAARDRIEAEQGRDLMMHEARQELLRLLFDGVDALSAMRETEAYLRGLWRPRYDYTKATFEPPTTTLHVGLRRLEVGDVRASDEARARVAAIREELTEKEWELVCVFADSGSLRAAGERCGVSHETVRRAVKAARRVACDTVGV